MFTDLFFEFYMRQKIGPHMLDGTFCHERRCVTRNRAPSLRSELFREFRMNSTKSHLPM